MLDGECTCSIYLETQGIQWCMSSLIKLENGECIANSSKIFD